MANKKISELPYINGSKISGNTLVPLVTYFSATTGDTVHTYVSDLQTYLTSGITGNTSVVGNYLPLSGGTVTGGTIFTAGITANTISATTYQNLPSSTFSGGTVTGPTIFTNGLTANTISATTYQNLPTDIRVTGGTYSAGTITFTNNTGGTFNVTGLTTGSTSTVSGDFLPLSGGTVSGATRFLSGLTANTISADTLTVTDNISSTNRTLYRATPLIGFSESVDYENSKLWGINAPSIDWELRQIYDEQATMAINYSGVTRYLIDDIGQTSVDWQARKLYTSIGEEVFDWENGILTGQTNIESVTISATTYQNLPIGFTGAYVPLSGGTVTGGTVFTSGLTASTLNISTTPTTDTGTTTNYLTRDGSTGEVKVKTIPGPTVYGLFSQTGTSVAVSATTVESTLINGGIGTLSVPANGFQVGDSFNGVLIGHLSCVGTATLQIRIKTTTGVVLADTGAIPMNTTTNKHWKLDVNFTIRQLGVASVGSIASGGLFSYTKNSGNNFEGVNFSIINNTTFDTTISNTLLITAEWNTNNAGNSIYSEIFTLNKTY